MVRFLCSNNWSNFAEGYFFYLTHVLNSKRHVKENEYKLTLKYSLILNIKESFILNIKDNFKFRKQNYHVLFNCIHILQPNLFNNLQDIKSIKQNAFSKKIFNNGYFTWMRLINLGDEFSLLILSSFYFLFFYVKVIAWIINIIKF